MSPELENAMAHPDSCLHEADFKRLESLVEKVFGKMDGFLSEMRDLMVADARKSERMAQLEKDIDGIGEKMRGVQKALDALISWKSQFEGAVRVMLAIPVACTILTTAVAIYQILK